MPTSTTTVLCMQRENNKIHHYIRNFYDYVLYSYRMHGFYICFVSRDGRSRWLSKAAAADRPFWVGVSHITNRRVNFGCQRQRCMCRLHGELPCRSISVPISIAHAEIASPLVIPFSCGATISRLGTKDRE